MGILTDLFVATEGDLDEQLLEEGPAGRFQTLEAKRVDDVKLTTLNAIATDRRYGEAADFDERAFGEVYSEIPIVRDAGEEGPWLFKLPDRLVDALVAADAERLRGWNEEWSRTEEWRLDGVTASDDTLWVLDGLAQLARDARSSGRSVYLWLSL